MIGKPIQLSNTLATIVGVVPRDFHGVWPGWTRKLYLPLQYVNVVAGRDILNSPGIAVSCAAIARLQSGVSIRRGQCESWTPGPRTC